MDQLEVESSRGGGVVFSDHDAVRTIVLARPEKRNALNGEVLERLHEVVLQTARDREVHVVILKGEGSTFCSGVDRGFLAGFLASENPVDDVREVMKLIQETWNTLEAMPKTTIAQIHGAALGGGAELALACDMRTMADDATFALIHSKLGFLPETGGCSRLAAVVGVGRAKEMIITGRAVTGAEALQIGLVNRVGPAAELDAVTGELAKLSLGSAPLGIAQAKRIIDFAAKPMLATTLELEMEASLRLFSTQDAAEAAQAFAEKRPPRFIGR